MGCAWGAVSALAQGISPGPLSPETYKLGGFEPTVQLRSYYFDTESVTGGPKSEAWAVGGWAGVRSPWWGDLFQLGLLGRAQLLPELGHDAASAETSTSAVMAAPRMPVPVPAGP